MLFCMDIGNTNIVLGITKGDRILNHWRVRTERDITADELGILVGNLFRAAGIGFDAIKNVIVSCVVPPLLNTIEEFSLRYFNTNPMMV
jgi:type III pantothenate kinase